MSNSKDYDLKYIILSRESTRVEIVIHLIELSCLFNLYARDDCDIVYVIHIECMLGHAWAGRPVLLSIVTDLDIYIYI